VIWEFTGEAIPDRLVADAARLGEALAAGRPPCAELSMLLDGAEIAALGRRIRAIVADPAFPPPVGPRPYPWPPV
jgi:hypothetical protein